MEERRIEYRLRHKVSNKYLTYEIESNGENADGNTESYILREYTEYPVWYATFPEAAEWVRHNSTEWYNSDFETPTHYYKPEELEVVKVEVTHIENEEKLDVKIPTRLDFYKEKLKQIKSLKKL